MKVHENHTDLLSDYLFNEMDVHERELFAEKMQADPHLRKTFQTYDEIRAYLKERISYEEMRDDPQLDEARRIAGLIEDPAPEKSSPAISRRLVIPLAIAASLTLALFIIRSTPVKDNSALYEKYYEPLNVVGGVYRGGEASTRENELESGLMLYQGNDYTGAEEVFSKLAKSSPLDPVASLYLGLSKMANSKYEAAITIFNNHIVVFDKYIPEAQWYLSLCYLKTGGSEEALKELKELSESGGYFGDKANDILPQLR